MTILHRDETLRLGWPDIVGRLRKRGIHVEGATYVDQCRWLRRHFKISNKLEAEEAAGQLITELSDRILKSKKEIIAPKPVQILTRGVLRRSTDVIDVLNAPGQSIEMIESMLRMYASFWKRPVMVKDMIVYMKLIYGLGVEKRNDYMTFVRTTVSRGTRRLGDPICGVRFETISEYAKRPRVGTPTKETIVERILGKPRAGIEGNLHKLDRLLFNSKEYRERYPRAWEVYNDVTPWNPSSPFYILMEGKNEKLVASIFSKLATPNVAEGDLPKFRRYFDGHYRYLY